MTTFFQGEEANSHDIHRTLKIPRDGAKKVYCYGILQNSSNFLLFKMRLIGDKWPLITKGRAKTCARTEDLAWCTADQSSSGFGINSKSKLKHASTLLILHNFQENV